MMYFGADDKIVVKCNDGATDYQGSTGDPEAPVCGAHGGVAIAPLEEKADAGGKAIGNGLLLATAAVVTYLFLKR